MQASEMGSFDQLRGWMFITGTFLLFMLAGHFLALIEHQASAGAFNKHPISTHIDDAKVAFTNRLAKQSRTLPEAVAEYKRRYGRAPPRGFDDWWEFAKENDFKLVDEFDAIIEDLEPFWALSGEELRQRTYLVRSTRSAPVRSTLTVSIGGALAFDRFRAHPGWECNCRHDR